MLIAGHLLELECYKLRSGGGGGGTIFFTRVGNQRKPVLGQRRMKQVFGESSS